MSKFFKMSLREDLLLSNPNTDDEGTEQAFVRAGTKEIVDNLEKGSGTVCSTKSTYFSDGEIRCLSIVRAFLKNADFVILDEVIAFAGSENKHIIQTSLEKLSEGKTALMIAYRLSTMINTDRILVIENGRIVESSTHNKLLTPGGVYKELWSKYQKAANWRIGGDNK